MTIDRRTPLERLQIWALTGEEMNRVAGRGGLPKKYDKGLAFASGKFLSRKLNNGGQERFQVLSNIALKCHFWPFLVHSMCIAGRRKAGSVCRLVFQMHAPVRVFRRTLSAVFARRAL